MASAEPGVINKMELARQKQNAARKAAAQITPGQWFDDPTEIKRDGQKVKIYYSVRRYVPENEVHSGGYKLRPGEYIKDGLVRTQSGREKRLTRRGHGWNEEVTDERK